MAEAPALECQPAEAAREARPVLQRLHREPLQVLHKLEAAVGHGPLALATMKNYFVPFDGRWLQTGTYVHVTTTYTLTALLGLAPF